ncbi:hypothetical protein [Labilibaculum euxinus]
MKDLQKLNGAKILSKKEQQIVKGGYIKECKTYKDCWEGFICSGGICISGEI